MLLLRAQEKVSKGFDDQLINVKLPSWANTLVLVRTDNHTTFEILEFIDKQVYLLLFQAHIKHHIIQALTNPTRQLEAFVNSRERFPEGMRTIA